MKTISVTGGIGSGKSAVCAILRERGIPVYDTDAAAKNLYSRDDSLLDAIEEAFGCGVRQSDGLVDSSKLASIAFSSKEKLRTLERIVHPAVLRDFLGWNAMQSARFEGQGGSPVFFGKEPFCVMESAIILDKPEFLSAVNKVVMVDAPLSQRLERACRRDGVAPESVIERMSMQHFDLSEVNAFIRNNGTLAQLKTETEKVFSGLVF